MARLKTYGSPVQVPYEWPLETKSHHRQRTVIVATTSAAKAVEAINAATGQHLSVNYLRTYGFTDMGGAAAEAATARPGEVLWRPDDHVGDYVPVPQ